MIIWPVVSADLSPCQSAFDRRIRSIDRDFMPAGREVAIECYRESPAGARPAGQWLGTATRMLKKPDREGHFSSLMRAAQNGDAAAYASLLKEVAPLLRNAVRERNRTLQTADVEDLVQDILLSLHAVRATYDPERPFLPWLFGIAHNRMADKARRYARRARHEVVVGELPEVAVTFSSNPTNREQTYKDPEALSQAIEHLPPAQREAVEMLKIREMSLKEASAASGISIAALKVSVHRAIKTLRKKLGEET